MLCVYDDDYSFITVWPGQPRGILPHENDSIFCCNYNPFTDDAKNNDIHDLGFALRKLAVMKCQMKKWRLERLKLESETRSLKRKLQSLGMDLSEPLEEDPLIIHYRDENIRLEKMKEQLEDRIRNLEETWEQNTSNNNFCKGVHIIRQKIRELRDQADRDKKKLEGIIKELEVKLEKTHIESSCVGVIHLRAKLRALMAERHEKIMMDKQLQTDAIEKTSSRTSIMLGDFEIYPVASESIEEESNTTECTLEFSQNGDNIELDGVEAQSQNADESHDNVNDQSILEWKDSEDPVMSEKLMECNNLIESLKSELDEKNNMIVNLQRNVADSTEKMRKSYEQLKVEANTDKEKLKECENKVQELLRQLEESNVDNTESNRWKSEIDVMKGDLEKLKVERVEFLKELNYLRHELSEKNDQINEILIEQDKIINNAEIVDEKLSDNQEKSSFQNDNQVSQHVEIDQDARLQDSESTILKLSNSETDSNMDSDNENEEYNKLLQELEMCKKHIDVLNQENINNKENLYNCEDEKVKLNGVVKTLENERQNCEKRIEKLQMQVFYLENTNEKLQNEINNLKNSVHDIDSKLVMTVKYKDNAELELKTLKIELEQLISNVENARRDNENLMKERNILKNQLEQMQKKLPERDVDDNVIEVDDSLSSFEHEAREMKSLDELVPDDNFIGDTSADIIPSSNTQSSDDKDNYKTGIEKPRTDYIELKSNNGIIKQDSFRNIDENLICELNSVKLDLSRCTAEKEELKIELARLSEELQMKEKNEEFYASTRDLEVPDTHERLVDAPDSNFPIPTVDKQNSVLTMNDVHEEENSLKKHDSIRNDQSEDTVALKYELIALKDQLSTCQNELERNKKWIDSQNNMEVVGDRSDVPLQKLNVQKTDENSGVENNVTHKEVEKRQIVVKEIQSEVLLTNVSVEEMNALKDTLGILRKDLEKCTAENDRVKHELQKWQNDATRSRIEFDKIKNDNIKFIDEIKLLNGKIGDLNHTMNNTNLENSRLRENLKTIHREIEKITIESNKLRAENAQMNVDRDEMLRKQNEMADKCKNYVDNINDREKEIEYLKVENNKMERELKEVQQKLKSVSHVGVKEYFYEGEDEILLREAESKELQRCIEEVNVLKSENNELLKNLKILRTDVIELSNKSRENYDEASMLKQAQEEVGKWKQIAENLTRENAILNNNLQEKVEDLEKNKRDMEKIFEEGNSLMSETIGSIQLEDSEQWQEKIERLEAETERVRKENEILMRERDELSSMQRPSVKYNGLDKHVEDLRKENNEIISDSEISQEDHYLKKIEEEFEESSEENPGETDVRILLDMTDESNELLRAFDIIRMKMKKQRKGVLRMRGNLNNMVNYVWREFSEYTDSDDVVVPNTMNSIVEEVFELSNDLSVNISNAEKELMNFAALWRDRCEENTKLNNSTESMNGESLEALNSPEQNVVVNVEGIHLESWLNSLTLTQLADLHDKICDLTKNLVRQDYTPPICRKLDDTSSPLHDQDHLQQSYDTLNRKIAALRRQISEKRLEAGQKVFEMRQALRREQAELIRISRVMNQEKKHNLKLHFIIDESPCYINSCTAECAKSAKFSFRNTLQKE